MEKGGTESIDATRLVYSGYFHMVAWLELEVKTAMRRLRDLLRSLKFLLGVDDLFNGQLS